MNWKRVLQLYFSSLLIYGFGLLLIYFGPFFSTYLVEKTKSILLWFYIGFAILSPIYYLFTTNQESTNKPLLFIQGIRRFIELERVSKEEKVAFLFILVKLFFLPLMVQFFANNMNWLLENSLSTSWYAFTITIIFTLDTLVFAIGYSFEFKTLGNVVKSVDSTLFGWVVALASYPPFNSFIGKYVPWGASDYALFGEYTLYVRIGLIFLLVIYLFASFALGPKASNLTNRGIVTRFPYSIVRHPAYICKMSVWWITLLPIISLPIAFGMLFWTIIYYFRAITEERHLLDDPEYKEYCKNVKWRFIPYLY